MNVFKYININIYNTDSILYMIFYKINKFFTDELHVISLDENKCSELLFDSFDSLKNKYDAKDNDDLIIHKKRRRDLHNSEKKGTNNLQGNTEYSNKRRKNKNLYYSINHDINAVCKECNKQILCGSVHFNCRTSDVSWCNSCYTKTGMLDKGTVMYITELYRWNKNYEDTIMKKKILVNNVINNDFLSKTQKELALDIYSKSLQLYKRLNNFARICKQRKALLYDVDCDLFLNKFEDLKPNIMTKLYIAKTNTFYKFRISDLIGVIENALTHSPDIFIEPYFPRNPYTNCQFTKAELYNIYFIVKESSFVMSQLFHNFFLVNFELTDFSIFNDDLLREIAVTTYSENMCNQELMAEFEHMEDNCKKHMPKISASFSRLEVAKRLKPQVVLFVRYSYTNSKIKRFHYFNKLIKQLEKIKKENPFFVKKSYFSRKLKKKENKSIQSQMVDGVFVFGHNPENEIIESESSISTDEIEQQGEQTHEQVEVEEDEDLDNEENDEVEPYMPEPLHDVTPSTPTELLEDFEYGFSSPELISENSVDQLSQPISDSAFREIAENAIVEATQTAIDELIEDENRYGIIAEEEEFASEEERIRIQEERLSSFRRLIDSDYTSSGSESESKSESESDSESEIESDGIQVTV